MEYLESFYVDGGSTTDAGLSELLEALPGLHIHLDQRHLDNDPRAHDHSRPFRGGVKFDGAAPPG